ncbi:PREDICTED: regulating synaptic membrane exocytosis protein 2-like, partial [Cariama cristata]|uniref:regulating synaptic membrane exocytosis protein 2-like n=1 Tax=Cariama cristata TaxID=54380 RepID=UPI000520A371
MGKSLSLSAFLLCAGETVVVRMFYDGLDVFAKVCETFGRAGRFVQYRSGRDPQRGSDNVSNKSSDSDVSDVSAVSRTSSASRFSSTSYMSVQSERPRGNKKISVFTSKMQSRQMGASGKNMTKSTSIGGDMYTLEKNEASQSDTAVGTVGGGGKKRRSSIGAKMVAIVGLSRKSRSTSQLSQT